MWATWAGRQRAAGTARPRWSGVGSGGFLRWSVGEDHLAPLLFAQPSKRIARCCHGPSERAAICAGLCAPRSPPALPPGSGGGCSAIAQRRSHFVPRISHPELPWRPGLSRAERGSVGLPGCLRHTRSSVGAARSLTRPLPALPGHWAKPVRGVSVLAPAAASPWSFQLSSASSPCVHPSGISTSRASISRPETALGGWLCAGWARRGHGDPTGCQGRGGLGATRCAMLLAGHRGCFPEPELLLESRGHCGGHARG